MRCPILRFACQDLPSFPPPPFTNKSHQIPKASRLDVHKNGAPLVNHVPGSIDICTALDEQTDYKVVPARARDMKGEDAVDDGVDGLPMVEGICNKAEVPRGCSGMEAKMGNCIAGFRHR